MATFKKGEPMKGQEIYIAGAFPQKGKGMTGYNIAFGIANDQKDVSTAKTDPMLRYDKYKDGEGTEKISFTESYSAKQYEAIMEVANTEGDMPVLTADLFPKNKGLRVNTNAMSTREQPFDHEAHKATTLEARVANAAAREAAAAEKEAEAASAEPVEADLEA